MSGESSQTRIAGFQPGGDGRGGDRGERRGGFGDRRRDDGGRLGEGRDGGRRHGQQEAGAGADRRRGEDQIAAHQAGQAPRHAQPEPGSAGPRRRRTAELELLEDAVAGFGLDARPGVLDADVEHVGTPRDVDADVAALGELRGVGHEVEHDLADAQLVDQQAFGHLRIDAGQDLDAFTPRQAVDRRDHVADQLADRGGLRIGGDVPRRQPRVVEQVVDQPQQVRAVAEDDLRVFAAFVRRRAVLPEQPAEAEDGRERRAQFVRDVVDEAGLQVGGALGRQAFGDEPLPLAPQPDQLLHAECPGRAQRGDQRRDEGGALVEHREQRHGNRRDGDPCDRRRQHQPRRRVPPCRVDRERHRERDEEQQQIPAPRRRAQHPLLRQQHRREAREVDAGDPSARRLDRVVEHQRARADEDAAIADERGERRVGVGGQRGPGQAIEPDRRQPAERPRIPELGAALLVDGEGAIAEAQHAAVGRRPLDAGHGRVTGLSRHGRQPDCRQDRVAGAMEQRHAAHHAVVVGLHGDDADAAGAAQLGPRRRDVGPGRGRHIGGRVPAEAGHRGRAGGVGGQRERHGGRGDDRARRAIERGAQLGVAGARLGVEHVEDDAAGLLCSQVVDDAGPHVATVGPRAGQGRELGERAIVDVEDDGAAVGVGQRRRDQPGCAITEPAIQLARDRRRADGRGDGEAHEDGAETIAPPVARHRLAARKAAITSGRAAVCVPHHNPTRSAAIGNRTADGTSLRASPRAAPQ